MGFVAPFIPAVLGAITSSFVSGVVGGGIIGGIIGGLAGAAVVAFTAPIFAPKPKVPKFSPPSVTSIANGSRGRTEMINQPITAHRIVYGQVRVSGPLVFTHSRAIGSSEKLDMLHWVIVLAAHEVEEIGDIIFNDEVVPLDGNGAATADPYYQDSKAFAHVYKHLGDVDQDADQVLIDNSGGQWTSAHRLRGLAYIHTMLEYDDKVFASGTPNISAIVKGRKLYDPRTSTTVWSDNAALCILDYLISDFGIGANVDDVDMNSFITGANICDESVATLDGTEPRYTCNGVVDLSDTPRDILENMLSSCAASLVYTGGSWRLHVGAYSPPVKTYDETFLRDAVIMRPHRSRRQLFNGVKGAFVSPDHNWQSTDYPSVQSSLYVAEDDGDEVYTTLDLSFTTSHTMAQRIARIALEQMRRQRQIQYPANLAGLQVAAGNTIAVDLPRFGINGMPCRITNWQMVDEMGIDMTFEEDGESVYAFDAGDLRAMGDSPQVVVPNNQSVPPIVPQNVGATAGGDYITISWDQNTESDFRYVEVWEKTSFTATPEVDAVRIMQVYDNEFTRNFLPGSEQRYYWLRAVDRYGNKSDFADPVQATTTGDQTVVLVLE
ncbi:MAG: hypothetical protein H6863_03850 [Rhodospirillales bacterium]|nr:hypothetical protein [Rhodospirillales bacterium]